MSTPSPATDESGAHGWEVFCLCAQWCGTCRDWRPAFEQAARALSGTRSAWVDIEDEADAVGDVDIETFPTLLVAHQGQVRFLGPVLPQAVQLSRLLSSLRHDPAARHVPDMALARDLYARIRLIGASAGK